MALVGSVGCVAGCLAGVGATLGSLRCRRSSLGQDVMPKALGGLHVNLVGLGDELGLFKAFLKSDRTLEELARCTGCDARYLKEWCLHMTASGVLKHDSGTGSFSLTSYARSTVDNENALAVCYVMSAQVMNRAKLLRAFKTGEGVDWNEQDNILNVGVCRFITPVYQNYLVAAIPNDIKATLERGGKVADVGCGLGESTCVMAKAFPKSRFYGYDSCGPAIMEAKARHALASARLKNVQFSEMNSRDFGSLTEGLDVVCFFNSFHEMACAGEAAARAHRVLKPGGQVFLIESMGPNKDVMKEHLRLPTASFASAMSCHVCLPCGKCNGGDALGAVVATERLREMFLEAGFQSLDSVPSVLDSLGTFRTLVARKR